MRDLFTKDELIDDLTKPATIYGYNIEHLVFIARVLQKENLPPERVAEILTDITRIVTIVIGEFEEAIRKVVIIGEKNNDNL